MSQKSKDRQNSANYLETVSKSHRHLENLHCPMLTKSELTTKLTKFTILGLEYMLLSSDPEKTRDKKGS